MRGKLRKGDYASVSVDPIDEELRKMEREESKEDAQETRMLRLKEKRLKLEENVLNKEKKIEALRSGTPIVAVSTNPNPQSDEFIKTLLTNPEFQKNWLNYTEEQRTTLLAGITAYAGMQGGNMQNAGNVMPLLMMRMQQQPQTNIREIVELVRLISPPQNQNMNIVDAIKFGAELRKQDNPNQSSFAIMQEVKNFLEPLYKDRETIIKEHSPPPLTDQLAEIAKLSEILGFQKGGSSVEIEKMRLDNERWRFEKEWDNQKWQAENASKTLDEENKWNALIRIGTEWMGVAAPLINAAVDTGVSKIASFKNPPPATQQQVPPVIINPQEPQVIRNEMPCLKCGEKIVVEGFPDEVKCDKCGWIGTKDKDVAPLTKEAT